jgi:nicotinate-nucleotide pyrophosphorylase
LIAGWQMIRAVMLINDSCTLYDSQRFVIECPAPSTTIFLAMKNSIIFISTLSLVAMMLASCTNAFAPDETATGVTRQTNETPRERSAEDSVNSISGGHY